MNRAIVGHLDLDSPEFSALSALLQDPHADKRALMLAVLSRPTPVHAPVPDVGPTAAEA